MFNLFSNKVIKSSGRGQGEQWPIVLKDSTSDYLIDIIMSIVSEGSENKGKDFSIFKYIDLSVVANKSGEIISSYFDPKEYWQNGLASNITLLEWPNKAEADVKFNIKDASLECFATDYAINKENYRNKKDLNISLAGLSTTFSEFNIDEINQTSNSKFDKKFTCLVPTENIAFYSIVFDALEVKTEILTDGKEFWIVDAKLTTTEDPIVIKLYTPKDLGIIRKGGKYSTSILLLCKIQ